VSKYLGIFIIAVALAAAIIPHYTDCSSQGKFMSLMGGVTVPMKCHWTGIAEISTGAPLAVIGAMMIPTRRKGSLLTLGIMGSVLGIFAILLPNYLIGVCQTSMPCHTVMKPSLTVLGSLAIVGSVGAMVLSRKAKD
jgi:hypothetical protein